MTVPKVICSTAGGSAYGFKKPVLIYPYGITAKSIFLLEIVFLPYNLSIKKPTAALLVSPPKGRQ
jgi:hypothetical protein